MSISVAANATPLAHHVVTHDTTNSAMWIVASRADRGTGRKLTPPRRRAPVAAPGLGLTLISGRQDELIALDLEHRGLALELAVGAHRRRAARAVVEPGAGERGAHR